MRRLDDEVLFALTAEGAWLQAQELNPGRRGIARDALIADIKANAIVAAVG